MRVQLDAEDDESICEIPKIPFLSRATFVKLLNSQGTESCAASSALSEPAAIDISLDYSWNNYDGCDVCFDEEYYDGLINIDFSDFIENQVVKCINSDCVGFVLGDYRLDLSFNSDEEVVLKPGKLTQPLFPKISNEDGVK